MVSAGADPLARLWDRLDEASRGAVDAGATWRARAIEAEREVLRLRGELEALHSAGGDERGGDAELRRLRAENALLSSRTAEARQRVAALLTRLAVLEPPR